MQRPNARLGADRPRSPSGTPHGRVPRWPLRAGIVAVAGLALAAPMVAAEPASAPRVPRIAEAAPASPVERPVSVSDEFSTLGLVALYTNVADLPSTGELTPPAPAPPPPAPAPEPAPEPAPAPAPEPAPAPAPEPAPAPAPAPAVSNAGNWDRLAQCEAGGNWSINTGNGYYGGLQFSASSWQAVGGSGLPHQASRETQIAMGERLRAAQGWGAWPSCSRKLGLS